MTNYSDAINQQYGRNDINDGILKAFQMAGIDMDELSLDDFSRFDQLHTGGRKATRKLGEMAGLKPGMKILDVGCGIGGPARTLAADFDCQVVGLDITESYVQAAEMLTEKVGLAESVAFKLGNALELEFDSETFDVVWSQNAIMNIENKNKLFQELHRVLRKQGIFAMEAILAGEKPEVRFPVFWADDKSVSFVVGAEQLNQLLVDAGFNPVGWEDVTGTSIELARKARDSVPETPHPVGLHLLYTKVPEKATNTLQGFEDDTYRDVYAVFRRSD
jgi:SAM-dependent methyltransferase